MFAVAGSGMGDLRCHSPPSMAGRLLVEVGDDDLTCDPHRAASAATTTTTTTSTTSTPIITMLTKQHSRHHHRDSHRDLLRPTTETDIIWSLPPTTPRPNKAVGMTSPRPPAGSAVVSNDDTLIIGIVGGVVAFIAILVIVICIVRLRLTSNQYRGGPMAAGVPHHHHPGMLQAGQCERGNPVANRSQGKKIIN